MAAIFISTRGGDLFQSGVSSTSVVKVDFLDSILNKGDLAIYTDVSFQNQETLQFFLTFDDVIRHLHFGRGLGQITVNGIIFADCDYQMPGIDSFYQAFGEQRGEECMVSLGSTTFKGIVSACSCSIVAEPDTMFNFSISITVTEDNLN